MTIELSNADKRYATDQILRALHVRFPTSKNYKELRALWPNPKPTPSQAWLLLKEPVELLLDSRHSDLLIRLPEIIATDNSTIKPSDIYGKKIADYYETVKLEREIRDKERERLRPFMEKPLSVEKPSPDQKNLASSAPHGRTIPPIHKQEHTSLASQRFTRIMGSGLGDKWRKGLHIANDDRAKPGTPLQHNHPQQRPLEPYFLFKESPQLFEALKSKGFTERVYLIDALAQETGRNAESLQSELCYILDGDVLTKKGEVRILAVTLAEIAGISAKLAYKTQLERKQNNPQYVFVRDRAFGGNRKKGKSSASLASFTVLKEKLPTLLEALENKQIITRSDLVEKLNASKLVGKRSAELGGLKKFLAGNIIDFRSKPPAIKKMAVAVAIIAGLDQNIVYRGMLKAAVRLQASLLPELETQKAIVPKTVQKNRGFRRAQKKPSHTPTPSPVLAKNPTPIQPRPTAPVQARPAPLIARPKPVMVPLPSQPIKLVPTRVFETLDAPDPAPRRILSPKPLYTREQKVVEGPKIKKAAELKDSLQLFASIKDAFPTFARILVERKMTGFPELWQATPKHYWGDQETFYAKLREAITKEEPYDLDTGKLKPVLWAAAQGLRIDTNKETLFPEFEKARQQILLRDEQRRITFSALLQEKSSKLFLEWDRNRKGKASAARKMVPEEFASFLRGKNVQAKANRELVVPAVQLFEGKLAPIRDGQLIPEAGTLVRLMKISQAELLESLPDLSPRKAASRLASALTNR